MSREMSFFEKLKSRLGLIRSNQCYCQQGNDGQYYCFKSDQGRWIECKGPYATKQECLDQSGGNCD